MLVVGGQQSGSTAIASAELFDPQTGAWTPTGSLNTARWNHKAVLLPNGMVLVAGGELSTSLFASIPELYDPLTAKWTATGPLQTTPIYHTLSLLPNGTALVAGGQDVTFNLLAAMQVFDPGVGANAAWRPVRVSPAAPAALGGPLTLAGTGFEGISEGSLGTVQSSAANYPLVQLISVEGGLTTWVLPANFTASSFTSRAIAGMPVGYALAAMSVNGVPGTGSMVPIDPQALVLSSPGILSNGEFRFWFTNTPGQSYTVFAATNVAQALNTWTVLGPATEVVPGQFEYTDPQTSAFPWRFYRVRSP